MFYSCLKKILFQLDPEHSHEFTFRHLKRITGTPLQFLISHSVPTKSVDCMGLSFKNPLGLAAGLDKNGDCIDVLGAMGFGFIEVGTVTPLPQQGNQKPRLFRVTEAEALINRMGFNNLGVDYLINNIKRSRFGGVLGINIGKNKETPLEVSKEDYLICMDKVYPYAGYIAVNISSPNTEKLRQLQYGDLLEDMLTSVKKKQTQLHEQHDRYVPVAVKISPDLSEEELIKLADAFLKHEIDGVIATNTTLDHSLIQGLNHCQQSGGLSGRPLQLSSNETIRLLSKELKGRIPIIGVGGIDSLMAAREKIAAGASLLQLYSGLIFQGPALIKKIIHHI